MAVGYWGAATHALAVDLLLGCTLGHGHWYTEKKGV